MRRQRGRERAPRSPRERGWTLPAERQSPARGPRFGRRPDTLLALDIAAGDREAFEELFRRYAPQLTMYARKRVPSPDRADDVVQQAFLNLALAIADGAEMTNVRAFLYRVASNLAVDEHRRRTFRPLDHAANMAGPHSVAEQHATNDWRNRLHSVVSGLPERARVAFVLCELRGFSYDEVASEMATTTDSVRQLVHRARRAVRERAEVAALLPGGPAGGWTGGLLPRLAEPVGVRLAGLREPWQAAFARVSESLAPIVAAAAAVCAICAPQLPALLGGEQGSREALAMLPGGSGPALAGERAPGGGAGGAGEGGDGSLRPGPGLPEARGGGPGLGVGAEGRLPSDAGGEARIAPGDAVRTDAQPSPGLGGARAPAVAGGGAGPGVQAPEARGVDRPLTATDTPAAPPAPTSGAKKTLMQPPVPTPDSPDVPELSMPSSSPQAPEPPSPANEAPSGSPSHVPTSPTLRNPARDAIPDEL